MNRIRYIGYKLIKTVIIYVLMSKIIFPQSINFQKISTSDGLSNNLIYDIIQDKTGFIWIATDNGLNRFDGYDFKIFRGNPKDENSLADNSVWALAEDKDGKLWLGTKSGWLHCYDPVKEKFSKWYIASNITKENTITAIYPEEDKIWIGTYRSGLYRFNPQTGKIENWRSNPFDSSTLSYNYISSIIKDDEGNIWLATYNGLTKVRKIKSEVLFERFYKDDKNQNSLSDNILWNLSIDEFDRNILWIGTANHLTSYNIREKKFQRYIIPNPDNLQFGTGSGYVIVEFYDNQKILWINSYAGLLRYNLTTSNVDRFTTEKNNPYSLPSDRINKIYRDKSGVLWIGTDNGLAYFSPKKIKFNYIISPNLSFLNSKELYSLNINAIAITNSGTVWIGTEKGLYYSDDKKTVKKFSSLGDANIWSLFADKNNNLWVGTYGLGFYQIINKTKKIVNWTLIDKRLKSVSRNFVKSIFADDEGKIWIGYWGLGLARLNPITKEFNTFLHSNSDAASLSFDDVWAIFQDRKGRIWIGTNGGGLNIFQNDSSGFIHLVSELKAKIKLGSNSIYSICESRFESANNRTVLWIGTNNGLTKLIINETKETDLLNRLESEIYTVENGLPDNSIKSLIEDNRRNLWIGTSSGVSMFNPLTKRFINFSTDDGLISNDINLSAAAMLNNNLIFMGSKSGLIYFQPDYIRLSEYSPPVLITDFRVFNKSVKVSEESPLVKSIIFTDKISIPHSSNVFSISFAALDFNSPRSIKYAYKLESFDKDWIYDTARRSATYTNLYPGEYIFKVKATNSDGVWNDNIKTLKVIILPPWWQTYWAIGIYILVFVLGIWGIVRFQVNREKLRSELKRQEFEAHHLREVEKMKSRFFANLSHEFRTPLMLIKGPLEALINGKIKENISEYYKMLLRNTEKLHQLIDQLLELSQLETESIPLKTELLNLVSVVKSCFDSFMPLAKQKNINYIFNSSLQSAAVMIDKDKLEKIINNLLSNAFKFTPLDGNISVNLSSETNSDFTLAKISVIDSGIGIPKDEQEKIFNRFYQVDDSSKRSFGGSGIGLALVKELVTLHKWNIKVNSEEGSGTEFIIEIPLTNEKIYTEISHLNQDIKEKVADIHLESQTFADKENVNGQKDKSLILFVEDSEDVRKYVYDLLKTEFEVLLAESGETGIEISKNSLPDLIISDVMMPGMDGFEFCKKIKTDWKTSHIPVILLTAKVDHQSKLDGLELGADDYISKPFDYNELFIRIKNLLAQRKQLKEKFSKNILVKAETITGDKSDQEFIAKLISVIEKYLHDENFDSEILAKEVFVSRSQLTRKLHSILGQGPGEFIRNYKLNRAAQMILENKLSITQVALEVGFGSPAQFTRAFQKHFNCLPSEFKHIKP